MTRKTLVGLFLSLLLGVILAACSNTGATGGASNDNAATQESGNQGGDQQELNVYNWSTYIAPDLIPKFEEMYNVKVNYDIFADNDELLAKIQPGNPGYDIIVPTDYMVEMMIAQDLLETLDKS